MTKLTNPFRPHLTLSLLIITSLSIAADPPLSLSGLYTDHMVIQREKPIKISGNAKPGNTIKIEFNGANSTATADNKGNWMAELPEQKAGGPYTMTVSDSSETTSIKDVLIGDIWICSGQSNMDFQLKNDKDAKTAIPSAANPNLRLYKVQRNKTLKPLSDLESPSQWQVSSPETVPDFTAVGYYFGKELQKDLNVPIGLIHTAWGGTRAEWWTPAEGLENIPTLSKELKQVKNGTTDEQLRADYGKKLEKWMSEIREADPGINAPETWTNPKLDDSNWETVTLPENKKTNYFVDHDGTGWYRKNFTLPADALGKPATLKISAFDDYITVFFNGKKIGQSSNPMKAQSYDIAASDITEEKNTVAIQVLDIAKAGGISGKISLKSSDAANPAAKPVELSGPWKFRPGIVATGKLQPPTNPPHIRPTVLYNAMIAPLEKLPIRGVIWYQGESNAHADQQVYSDIFSNMITQWRKGWGQGNFPFLYVQIASYMKIEPQPIDSGWAELREQQELTMTKVPNTGMASAIDVGDEDNIHPTDKSTVGKRLALGALALEYGKDSEYMGPIYKSSSIKDDKITLSFTHAETLKIQPGTMLKGFAIAEADGKFVWASARIEGNKVVVFSDKVKNPTTVRYGWANFSEGNLYNGANLPASPFRTDRPEM